MVKFEGQKKKKKVINYKIILAHQSSGILVCNTKYAAS